VVCVCVCVCVCGVCVCVVCVWCGVCVCSAQCRMGLSHCRNFSKPVFVVAHLTQCSFRLQASYFWVLFAKLRKATISFRHFCPSVRPSVRPSEWNKSVTKERILIKFYIWGFFSTICPENSSFITI